MLKIRQVYIAFSLLSRLILLVYKFNSYFLVVLDEELLLLFVLRAIYLSGI